MFLKIEESLFELPTGMVRIYRRGLEASGRDVAA
jgi:hypothetical protein